MKETELRQALDDAITSCQLSSYRRYQILAQMKGENEPVKTKMTVSLAVVIAVLILTLGAAVALVHSNIADHLYRYGGEAPDALLAQIQTPQETAASPLGSLTLDELFYDGRALHTSVTLSNPTDETLLYTVDSLSLGNLPLDRTGGDLLMEGAGSAGVLLGGTVDGIPLPESYVLYHEAAYGHLMDENGTYLGQAAIPQGENTLRLTVTVWRPIQAPQLVDYRLYEGENNVAARQSLVTDETGYCNLWLFRPEEAYRAYNASQSGSEMYADVFRQLGWAERVDTIALEVPVNLTGDGVQLAKPTKTSYQLDGCTLTLTRFQLSHAGGQLEGDLTGDPQAVRQLLRDGLQLVDREGRRLLNNGSYWGDLEDGKPVHLTMMLSPVSGELPKEVWLAPAKEMNSQWDPLFAGPTYDPAVPVPEDAISIYRLDYDRGCRMEME